MSTTEDTDLCRQVEDTLGGILDGSASAALFDHLAGCDRCRDLKHDAARVAEMVEASGADFRPADDFVEKLVGRLEAARPEGAAVDVGSPPDRPAGVTAVMEAPAPEPVGTTLVSEEPDPAAVPPEAPPAEAAEEAPAVVPFSTGRLRAVSATSHHGDEAPRSGAREAAMAPRPAPAPPPAATAGGQVISLFRRPRFLAGVLGAVAAAAAVGFYLKGRPTSPSTTSTESTPWSGAVTSVSRAAADKTGGLDLCDAAGACAPAAPGAAVKAGTTLRTDARSRAHVTLADGTELSLDRASEVELAAGSNRAARVKRGTMVADVAHLEGSTAHIACAQGDVEVLGTKLAITADDDRASIEVARGAVRFTAAAGKTIDVRAGEEATIVRGAEPVVASAASLSDVMEWSDRSPEEIDSPVLRGIGELRARKPGAMAEKDHAVRLARHAVKVRIADVAARTEVDETFANDSDDELEGIFRFPLPPGAQIERLALEVDGKLVDGAFVDRDRGAAIWRGVLQNAAPKAPKPREEIIWVPGPWRDPALLEWQRGGRFELKIFPIPKHGSRRIVLAYTQTAPPSGGIRRYSYPLAHDAGGTTKIDSFDLDLQVLGIDKAVGLTTRGYDLVTASGEGERRTMHADGFIPAGDLTVEYALPDRDREVTAWAYSMAAPPAAPAVTTATARGSGKTKNPEEQAAIDAATAIASDTSPYVAIALRPRLPRWQEAKERLHVLVVDDSRSMVGERFARATHLASSIVREMDRRDSFLLLACDTLCRPMGAEAGGAPRPLAPGASAADDVERFLGQIEPDGGSDLAAAVTAATLAANGSGKELRVLYLGDGTPTVGPTRAAHLEAAVRATLPTGGGSVVAVALGSDADTTSLEALARGGGGVVVPYVPGQKVSSAALDVLAAAYGATLRDPRIELPAGLTQVTPVALDPMRAGGETFVFARMSGGREVSGAIKLKGRVAGEAFEQSYPVRIVASEGAGNAFVPRMYAAARIAELERTGSDVEKPTVIELSKRFAVASRFTSLLVLESEAMFKAFGVDRGTVAPSFTGEEQAESSSSDAEGGETEGMEKSGDKKNVAQRVEAKSATRREELDAPDAYKDDEGPSAGTGFARGAPAGHLAPGMPAPSPRPSPATAAAAPAFDEAPMPPPPPPAKMPSQKPAPAPSVAGPADLGGLGNDLWHGPTRAPRRMIPMHKVFDRKASFDAGNALAVQNASRLAAAEGAAQTTPDSRDRTVDLYTLYATSGRLGEAQELTARWSGRDALDPEALTARSDLAARQGDRDRAIRILGGLADVRPGDRAIQARLADLEDAAGNPGVACEHRIALADMALAEAKPVADAVRCARTRGLADLANLLRLDAGEKVRDAIDKLLLASAPAASAVLLGDIQIAGEWTGGADLDLALIDAHGHRTSWLGSPFKGVTAARDATSTRGETLSLSGLPSGSYVLEVSRAGTGADPSANTPVSGEVTLHMPGGMRKIPFALAGPRAELGTLRVFFTSRLVPVDVWGRPN
jgi:hypothetical protein